MTYRTMHNRKIKPSILVNLPSIINNSVKIVDKHKIGRSFLITCLEIGKEQIRPLIPNTAKTLKILEPITLLIDIALEFSKAATIDTAAAGALVPKATMVSQMIIGGIFNNRAMALAPSTKMSAPLISKINPIISKIMLINIISSFQNQHDNYTFIYSNMLVKILKNDIILDKEQLCLYR